MTIDVANRLVKLRKEKGYSQEELAEKLGLSRQAVSKWERAEASPDTDNLILLARIYGVSLDDLLNIDSEDVENLRENNAQQESEQQKQSNSHVHVSLRGGVHVVEGKDEVHVGWNGIHITEHAGDNIHIGDGKIVVNGREYDKKDRGISHALVPLLTIFAYLWLGFGHGLWHPGWLVFFLIPIYETLWMAVSYKDGALFAYPVLLVAVFLSAGILMGMWHPTWVIFFTIPLYYSICAWAKRKKQDQSPEGK